MDVKEAARIAKEHVADLFKEEGAKNIGLEEIEFDEAQSNWRVTVGFSRPWTTTDPPLFSPTWANGSRQLREMKVVTLNDADGHILFIRRPACEQAGLP
jgi:hypothetical protein